MQALIAQLKEDQVLKDPRIIDAFTDIDRKEFLTKETKEQADQDQPLPIGKEQTNSQPTTVATMLELLEPKEGDNILDVGSGSGWTTALLAHITGTIGRVTSVEKIPSLCEFGYKNVEKYNYISDGVVIHMCGDATKGVAEQAPYDRILVSAMASELPEKLIEQLKPGGVMVCPYKDALWKVTKNEDGTVEKEEAVPGFSFVPLVSEG